MTNAKRGMIPAHQLFFILFISRIIVSLTYIRTVSVGKMSSDILISIAMAYFLTMLASLPAYFCCVKNKNPFDTKWVAVFYVIYFIYFASENISRFSYFASSRLNPEARMVFFVIIIAAAVCYAAVLGIESLGRFSLLCGAVLIGAVLSVIIFNLKNMEIINFYPMFNTSRGDVFQNSVVLASNSIEPAVLLALSGKVNGKESKAYFFSVTASYAIVFLLMFFCIGTMGSAASLQSFPIFTLFQMASIGNMSRLDVIHTAFWVFAVFLKCAVLIYCISISVKKFSHKNKCIAAAVIVGIISIISTELIGNEMINSAKTISLSAFAVFVLIIPILFLIFKKKSKGEKVIEKF